MVAYTIFEKHLLEVSLTQKRETMAFHTLITVDFFFILSCVRTGVNRNSLK